MIGINRTVFLHLEHIIAEYPRIDEFIDKCKTNPFFDIDDEQRILTLKQYQSAIGDTLNQSDETTQLVINKMYFKRNPNQTIDGLAVSLHISRSSLFYKRNKFLESVRHKLGW